MIEKYEEKSALISDATTKIVFACKSNSCRSQMAEGWARNYLLKNDLMDKSIVVASVALDSASVWTETESRIFEQKEPSSDLYSNSEKCCGDSCGTIFQRKSVKVKAVHAMEKLGVESKGTSVPKSWEEILPIIRNADCQIKADKMLVEKIKYIPVSESETYDIYGDDEACYEASIDRLIVLCSCGGTVRNSLGKMSRCVEEWNVDAPTAMSKSGEGDQAYERVSLEIKEKVYKLMDEMIQV